MENNLQIHSVYEGLVVKYTDKGEKVVDARDLHEFLQVKRQFSDWIKTWIAEYEENLDFATYSRQHEMGSVKREVTEYILKLDMAKELCMMSKTEKGKVMRKYFIEIERRYMEDKQREQLEFNLKMLRENGDTLLDETKLHIQKEIHSLVTTGSLYIREDLDKGIDEHKFLVLSRDEKTGGIMVRTAPVSFSEESFTM